MRSIPIRSARKSTKILAGGALLTVCAAGGVMTNAHADVPTTLKEGAWFTCNTDDCTADGLGSVQKGEMIISENDKYSQRKVRAVSRAVTLLCKATSAEHPDATVYLVTVQEANWSGKWGIDKLDLSAEIDDSSLPTCVVQVGLVTYGS
jgi:hypothetical protein